MLRDGPVLVLGGGSNLLFAGDPPGVVLALDADVLPIQRQHHPGWVGSNLLFAGDPPGVVLALDGQDIRILEDEGETALVRAEAGVEWHAFVLWTLGHGLAGLENLALIPGTVGAAPIQNIGAYGVEVRESIHAVEAFDRSTHAAVRLSPGECAFAYRDSRFKREADRWVVTAVEFRLRRTPDLRLGYAGI